MQRYDLGNRRPVSSPRPHHVAALRAPEVSYVRTGPNLRTANKQILAASGGPPGP